jgi:hypothetical protein
VAAIALATGQRENGFMADSSLEGRGERDPNRRFATPEEVLASPDLDADQKRAILERWRQNSGSPVSGEGEAGGEPSMVTRLARALSFLDTETGGRATTHDQGFYTSVSEIGDDASDDREGSR